MRSGVKINCKFNVVFGILHKGLKVVDTFDVKKINNKLP
jgi:hypothetical protein